MMVLDFEYRKLSPEAGRISCGNIIRMQVTRDGRWLGVKNPDKRINLAAEAVFRLRVVKIADMPAEKSVFLFSKAERVLLLRAKREEHTGVAGKGNRLRDIPARASDEMRFFINDDAYAVVHAAGDAPVVGEHRVGDSRQPPKHFLIPENHRIVR